MTARPPSRVALGLVVATIAVACGSASPTGPSSTDAVDTAIGGSSGVPVTTSPNDPMPPGGTSGPDVVLAGAGDIGMCGPAGPAGSGAAATARLLDAIPGLVFTLGDNVYMKGTAQEFHDCYDATWGRHRSRTRPVPGNHDYETAGAEGYFGYFGGNAGPLGLGYYAYTAGAWRIYALNSEIATDTGSAQYAWLRQELTSSPSKCAMAYWHKPLVSSGRNGDNRHMLPLWTLLYHAGTELVLNGHDHGYERFAPQDDALRADFARGIRQIVAGTGGATPYEYMSTRPNSEVRGTGLGVLKLVLRAAAYDWEFVPADGTSLRDFGSDTCH
ncbi:MAG: metallophosphoesterase [Vicinamibacterales bacterium]